MKFIPRYFFFVSGGLTNIALLVFLIVWERTPSFLVVFLFAFLWGTADAVWNTLTASKYSEGCRIFLIKMLDIRSIVNFNLQLDEKLEDVKHKLGYVDTLGIIILLELLVVTKLLVVLAGVKSLGTLQDFNLKIIHISIQTT